MQIIRTILKLNLVRLRNEWQGLLLGFLGFLISQIGVLFSLSLIVGRASSLSGWSLNESYLLFGVVNLAKGLDHILTDNLWFFSKDYVLDRSLDSYLCRPISTFAFLSFSRVEFSALAEIVVGFLVTLWSYFQLFSGFNTLAIILILAGISTTALAFFLVKALISSLALYVKESFTLLNIVYSLSEFAVLPLTVFARWLQVLLAILAPFTLTGFYSMAELMQKSTVPFFLPLGVIALYAALVVLLFRSGIQHYLKGNG